MRTRKMDRAMIRKEYLDPPLQLGGGRQYHRNGVPEDLPKLVSMIGLDEMRTNLETRPRILEPPGRGADGVEVSVDQV